MTGGAADTDVPTIGHVWELPGQNSSRRNDAPSKLEGRSIGASLAVSFRS